MMEQINRLWRRVYNVAGRGEIHQVDDTGKAQRVQVMFSPVETRDGAIRATEFGFSSNPPIGSDCLTLSVGGDRDNTIVISTGHKASRPINLQPGESVLYDDQGAHVWLKRAVIEIDAAGKDVVIKNAANATVQATTKITLDTPLVECTGDVKVDGTLTATTDVIGGGKHLKTHLHSGVTTGGGNTGAPV